jgi:hypothetical protein
LIKRKPESSHADKNYKAEEKKVIEPINTLEAMLKSIYLEHIRLNSP